MSESAPQLGELESTLRALGNKHRLEILKTLGDGAASVAAVARSVGLPRQRVDRHLAVLLECHLVKLEPSSNGRVYALDREQAALLEATFISVVGRIDMGTGSALAGSATAPGDTSAPSLASAPDACRQCQNSSFVRSMLDELDESLAAAREYDLRLREMSSHVLTAQEVERKRIARELHDDTAQALTSVLLRLRVLERSADDAQLREGLAELRDLTGATLDGVRRLAIDLRPPVLDDLGLEVALQAQARDFESQRHIKATVSSGKLGRMPPDVELVLYRIAQEALSNVAKHAQASQVEIRLTRRGRTVRMFIEDDGCGFDTETAAESHQSRLGLFGMKERLSLIGGAFGIESTPGNGTRVSAQVRLPASVRV